MRRSKYPSLGILEALERLSYDKIPDEPKKSVSREDLFQKLQASGIKSRIFSKRISSLATRGLLKRTKTGLLQLTKKGEDFLSIEDVDQVVFKNKKTDGYRRLIMFDIPEERRSARDILRHKLKEFECRQLQKSVYLTPYVCEDEILEIAKILRIQDNINVFKIIG